MHTSCRSSPPTSQEPLVFARLSRASARAVITAATMATAAACRSASVAPSSSQAVGAPAATALNPFDIAYRIGWGDPAAHLYDIQIDVARVSGDVVKFQMPVWSPGRYAPFYFARNV